MDGHIAIFGHDDTLLQTRKWVLEKYFRVEVANNLQSLFKLVEEQRIDLVMLCYSLTTEECEKAIDMLRVKSPRTQVLNLLDSGDHSRCAAGNPAYSPLKGPELLIKKTEDMLVAAQCRQPFPV